MERKTLEKRRKSIVDGQTSLGIELGSTRIKVVLIDGEKKPIAVGNHDWENRLVDEIWTYSLEDIWSGIQGSYTDLRTQVEEVYGVTIKNIKAIGVSAMMHGYMPFDKEGNLLVPFRTWRNTITQNASGQLSELFQFNIPQRWSIAHLYQAILNEEDHVDKIDYLVTLSGYVHWKLTGEKVLGIGDASGMFPIDNNTHQYDGEMISKFEKLIETRGYPWKLLDILPSILKSGSAGGVLTNEGASLLDSSGQLAAGAALCPPEGDAGTGMVATNSVEQRTGNVSAGTSIFAMVVLEDELKSYYEEIDLVTTPSGEPVAMVHCNNFSSDLNAWVALFGEFADLMGMEISTSQLFTSLYTKALEGDLDCGGLLSYCYLSGEHITQFEEGRPLFVRLPDGNFNLANFVKTQLFTGFGALRIGMDILFENENVEIDQIVGHGGLFKTEEVGQRFMAAALHTPISVMDTAGEGGAWGIALLADYMANKNDNETLADYLTNKVFINDSVITLEPLANDVESFNLFMQRYIAGLPIQRAAIDVLKS